MADWFDDIFGFVKDVGSVVGPVASVLAPVVGAAIGSNANDSNAAGIIQATNAQADQLQLGYDEQLQAKISGYDAARQFLDGRLAAMTAIYQTAAAQYGGDLRNAGTAAAGAIRAAAVDYAQKVPAAAQYLGDLLMTGTVNAGDALRRAAATGGADLKAAAALYGNEIVGAANEFGTSIDSGAADFRREIMQAPDAVQKMLGIYSDAGAETVPVMRSRAFTDPTRMTGSQQIQLDDERRAMADRLATTGMRGSAAGVAAAMDAENRSRERLVDANRARSDKYLDTLGQRGFTAANTIASAQQQALIQAAGVEWEASKLGASALLQAQQAGAAAAQAATQKAVAMGMDAEKMAQDAYLSSFRQTVQMQYGAQQSAAGVTLNADQGAARLLYDTGRDIATNDQSTSRKVAQETGNYFGQQGQYALSEAGDVGAAALAKREAEARSLGPVAAVQGAADVANAKLWGQGLGQITRTIADERASGYRPSAYNYGSSVPGGNDSTSGGDGNFIAWGGGPDYDPNLL